MTSVYEIICDGQKTTVLSSRTPTIRETNLEGVHHLYTYYQTEIGGQNHKHLSAVGKSLATGDAV